MERKTSLRQLGRGITAQSIMTANPVTVSPEATVEDVANILFENDFRHVPVVEDGKTS